MFSELDQLPAEIGPKATGLLAIPADWVPPFIAISPTLYSSFWSSPEEDRDDILKRWFKKIQVALQRTGIQAKHELIIRSNALEETLDDRGKYSSQVTTSSQLLECLRRLLETMGCESTRSKIGLIIQVFIRPMAKGHLSNQRRVVHEYRDALVETENIQNGVISEERISFRQWRKATPVNEGALVVKQLNQVSTVLREPLAHAARRSARIHYEWVWDGAVVHIVQADVAPDKTTGINPQSVIGQPVADETQLTYRRFRVAAESDVDAPGKLSNHFMYRREGFWQPEFYILDDVQTIESCLRGTIEDKLGQDLVELTQAPMMIRTAYAKERIPLLPRSPLLMNAEDAVAWLSRCFAPHIKEINVDPRGLTLIAHHYIHAAASAFSIASPSKQEVMIEALWGTPEGLYFYPCDVYTVHTLKDDANNITVSDYRRFRIKRTPRWKSHFVAPNDKGHFTRYEIKVPWDWKDSIQKDGTLCEIAAFTRKLAAIEKQPVSLMWFLDCNILGGKVSAIPWYHESLEDQPYQSSFQRNTRDRNYTIATEADLRVLESVAQQERDTNRRIVIELRPAEEVAIRDEGFAQRVGGIARKLDATIILHGASLSHIYYVLRRGGATVVTRHLADIASIREVHEKLVRDRIPEAVTKGGEVAKVVTLAPEAKLAALKIKLVEEAFEVRDASREQVVEELADVLEVYLALAQAIGVSPEEIDQVRTSKARERGGFDKGLMLIETGSGGKTDGVVEGELFEEIAPDQSNVVLSGRTPPLEAVRSDWGDSRVGVDFEELIQNASVSLTHPEWKIGSSMSPSLSNAPELNLLTWQLEGRREGATLKIRLRVRIGKKQIELPLLFQHESNPESTN